MTTLVGAVDIDELYPAAAIAATDQGAAVSIADVDRSAIVVLTSSAGVDADETLTLTIEERADAADAWAAVPADALFDLDTGANATFAAVTNAAPSFQKLGLRVERCKAQIRAVLTAAGTTPDFTAAVLLVKAEKYANI